jgi:hypothetical protein
MSYYASGRHTACSLDTLSDLRASDASGPNLSKESEPRRTDFRKDWITHFWQSERKMVKTTVESCLVLKISDLVRAGVFGTSAGAPGNCIWQDSAGMPVLRVDFCLEGNPSTPLLRLRYMSSAFAGIPICLDIRIDAIPCHFGGARRVFLCPGAAHNQCGRQATKLYFVAGRWVCRACGDLTYEARQHHDRRLDALARSPEGLFEALRSRKIQTRLMGLRAIPVACRRWSRGARTSSGNGNKTL